MSQLENRRARFLHIIKDCKDKDVKKLYIESMLKFNENSVRISKYDMRNMLHKHLEWSGKREEIFLSAHVNLLKFLIDQDKDIIIDDIALSEKHLNFYQKIAEDNDYDFRVLDLKDVLIEKEEQEEEIEIGKHTAIENNYTICHFEDCLALYMPAEANYPILDDSVAEIIDCDLYKKQDVVITSCLDETQRSWVENWLYRHAVLYTKLVFLPTMLDRLNMFDEGKLDLEKCQCVYDSSEIRMDFYKSIGLNVIDICKALKI